MQQDELELRELHHQVSARWPDQVHRGGPGVAIVHVTIEQWATIFPGRPGTALVNRKRGFWRWKAGLEAVGRLVTPDPDTAYRLAAGYGDGKRSCIAVRVMVDDLATSEIPAPVPVPAPRAQRRQRFPNGRMGARVPHARVKELILALRERGWVLPAIAARTGVSVNTLTRIIYMRPGAGRTAALDMAELLEELLQGPPPFRDSPTRTLSRAQLITREEVEAALTAHHGVIEHVSRQLGVCQGRAKALASHFGMAHMIRLGVAPATCTRYGRAEIMAALRATDFVLTRAAARLMISTATLTRAIRVYYPDLIPEVRAALERRPGALKRGKQRSSQWLMETA